ncbi:MAG TPA: hypothetical protein PKN81_08700 [Anaerolineales bacterium]|nr:hypothetical protein [Anaerolineales bacterium]
MQRIAHRVFEYGPCTQGMKMRPVRKADVTDACAFPGKAAYLTQISIQDLHPLLTFRTPTGASFPTSATLRWIQEVQTSP